MRLTISAAGVMSFGRIVLHTTLFAGCDCLAWGCCCRGGVFVRSLSGISREAALWHGDVLARSRPDFESLRGRSPADTQRFPLPFRYARLLLSYFVS